MNRCTCGHDQRDHPTGRCSECPCLCFVPEAGVEIDEVARLGGIDLDKPSGITMVPLGEAMRAVTTAIRETEQAHAADLHALRALAWEGWSRVYVFREGFRFLDE